VDTRPLKPTTLQALVPYDQTVSIEVKNLQTITTTVAEYEPAPGQRVGQTGLLYQPQ
jgi:hypothetical protein